jgi:hypothetical protein
MSRERWMALLFGIGSACFLVGPFPGYEQLVGAAATGVTFFVGSIFFTGGGLLQSSLAFPARREPGGGRADWWAAVIQSAGTLFFNVTTFQGMDTALSNPDYNRLVWRPDALGSICFLVSGVIAYRASRRLGWRPVREGRGWWMPAVNLLGCIFFGISAVAGYVVPASGSELDLAAANWNTSLGAACFLACAVATFATPTDQPASDAATSRGPSAASVDSDTSSSSSGDPSQSRAASSTAAAQASATSSAASAPPGGSASARRVTRSSSDE